MSPQMLMALGAVFLTVAFISGSVAMLVVSRPSRRRLDQLLVPYGGPSLAVPEKHLSASVGGWTWFLSWFPVAAKEGSSLRRQLLFAGFPGDAPVGIYLLSQFIAPVVLATPPALLLVGPNRWIAAGVAGALGYLMPSLLLGRRVTGRRREIQQGLADALDLLVLCLEAGSSLDQAMLKAGKEIEVAYPALADQFRILTTEIRAGVSRLEAFRGFADRTKVDDVRALVAMLVQTDRFGTSIAQALRTQAEVCRTKRRQQAEEKAEKVGVKLVFPLVFCLFPALYVVMLGPAFIEFTRVFNTN